VQVERIAEEKAQAAKARALTDALQRGLKIVNRSVPPYPLPVALQKINSSAVLFGYTRH